MSREQPPGWYPDRAGRRILHWWDGQRWTGDTRPPAGEGGPLFYQRRQSTFTPAQQQPPNPQQPAYPAAAPQHYQQPDPGWQPHSQQPPPGPQNQYQPPPGQPSYPPQWQPYTPPPQGQPPQRKRHVFRNINLGLGGLLTLLVVIIVATNKSNTPAVATGSSSATPAAAASSAPPAATAHTVATFTGSGQQNTPQFTVSSTWKLNYSFSCAAFGQTGNFAVLEDGGSDFNGVTVNDLAMSKSSSTWGYNDSGTHYLEIDSECTWKVTVIDEP